ncbi:MAG: homoaconitate hydratase, partial [Chloroflexi bacterium]
DDELAARILARARSEAIRKKRALFDKELMLIYEELRPGRGEKVT